MIYLPDTNVLSAYAKGNNRALVEKMEGAILYLVLSSIVLAELEYGWRKSETATKRIRAQKEFSEGLTVKPFGRDGARAYGIVKNGLLHPGRGANASPIGERDMLIAAHALSLGAVLVTANTKEFERVPDLVIENWES